LNGHSTLLNIDAKPKASKQSKQKWKRRSQSLTGNQESSLPFLSAAPRRTSEKHVGFAPATDTAEINAMNRN